MNSRAHSSNCRGRGHEHAFRFFLHNSEKRVELLDSVFRCLDRRDELLIRHRDGLAHLLNIHANRCRDVIRVVRNRARVPHDRVDVTVNAVEHVADLGIALPEIPRCRDERDCQYQQRDRSKSACIRRDLVERAYFRLDLFRDDRIGERRGGLQ